MLVRSRSLFPVVLCSAALLFGTLGCASAKPRNHWWEFWKSKSPAAEISGYYPDRMFVPVPPEVQGQDGSRLSDSLAPEYDDVIADLPQDVPLRQAPRGTVSELAPVHFAYDSAELDPEAQRVLETNLAWIQSHPGIDIQIEGHTDERGTREYNLLLGERRALSVRAYLVSRGAQNAALHTTSYGEERPLIIDDGEESYSQNRRAQFLVY